MPPKKSAAAAAAVGSAKKPRKKGTVYQMAPAIADGTIVKDNQKRQFKIGKAFAQGGFGRIYAAKQIDGNGEALCAKFEPDENGPMFTEISVYQRVAKPEMITQWKTDHNLPFLGIPRYISAGLYPITANTTLRYLIIPRYGDSLESLRKSAGGQLAPLHVWSAAGCCTQTLRYLHALGYVHADVKADNLLLAEGARFDRLVLIDYGLARKVTKSVEKPEKKKAHNGTALFTSLDAHRGCDPSFRGDFEILAYNLLYWLAGSLPWQKYEDDPERVLAMKEEFSRTVETSVKALVKTPDVKCLIALFKHIFSRKYGDFVDCDHVMTLIVDALETLPVSPQRAAPKSATRTKAQATARHIAIDDTDGDTGKAPPVKARKRPTKNTAVASPARFRSPPVKKSSKKEMDAEVDSASSSSTSRRPPAGVQHLHSSAAALHKTKPKIAAGRRRLRVLDSSTEDDDEEEEEDVIPATPPDAVVKNGRAGGSQSRSAARRPSTVAAVALLQRTPLKPVKSPRTTMDDDSEETPSPRAAMRTMIPGVANMRGVRKSLGVALLNKYRRLNKTARPAAK